MEDLGDDPSLGALASSRVLLAPLEQPAQLGNEREVPSLVVLGRAGLKPYETSREIYLTPREAQDLGPAPPAGDVVVEAETVGSPQGGQFSVDRRGRGTFRHAERGVAQDIIAPDLRRRDTAEHSEQVGDTVLETLQTAPPLDSISVLEGTEQVVDEAAKWVRGCDEAVDAPVK